jgi:hypothetical protein
MVLPSRVVGRTQLGNANGPLLCAGGPLIWEKVDEIDQRTRYCEASSSARARPIEVMKPI